MLSNYDKMKMGLHVGTVAPYGYRKDPGNKYHLVIDKQAAEVVRDIYRWFGADGMSIHAITRKLNDLEIPSPRAYMRLRGGAYTGKDKIAPLWSQTTISKILKNQMYLGHMVQGRYPLRTLSQVDRHILPEEDWIIVKNTHTPIIEQDVFDLAQNRHAKRPSHRSEEIENHMYAGFIRCPDCGRAMARITRKPQVQPYFQCHTYRDNSMKFCFSHHITLSNLNKAVLNAIKTQARMVSALHDHMDELGATSKIRNKIKRLSSAINKREREYEQALDNKAALFLDWKNGELDEAEYNKEKNTMDRRIKSLGGAIDALKKDRDNFSGVMGFTQSRLANFLKYKDIAEIDRNVLKDLVDVIYIHEKGKVEVIWQNKD